MSNKPEKDIPQDFYTEGSDPLSPAPETEHADQVATAEPLPSTETDDQIRLRLVQQELDRTKDQMIRALAEVENTRKRAAREREDAAKYAASAFARDILSVADNLRRALNSIAPELAENHPEVKNLMDGIIVTERELLRSFEKNGLQKIEPLDLPFDPNFHEVMFEAAIPTKPAGTVIQVVEPGYTLNGRLLRPARVGISKNDGPQAPPEAGHRLDTEA